jgi:hypothetical protein
LLNVNIRGNFPVRRALFGLRREWRLEKSVDKCRRYGKLLVFPDGVGAHVVRRIGTGDGPFKETT